MRRGRIRYGKLLAVLAAAALLIMIIGYGVGFFFSHLGRAPGPSADAAPEYYLFIGTEEGTGQADSLVLLAVNRARQEVYAVSLPGNTKISRDTEPLLLLRDVYGGSAEKAVSAAENLLHIRIDHYAVFNQAVFASLMDKYGGIDLYVEKDMYHEDASGTPDIGIRQGYQTLAGDSAYAYMRYIDGESGEIGRIQREERLMKAFVLRCRKNFRLYNAVMAYYGWPETGTNVTKKEAAMLAYDLTGYSADHFHFCILPGENRRYGAETVWEINPIGIQKIVGLTINQQES